MLSYSINNFAIDKVYIEIIVWFIGIIVGSVVINKIAKIIVDGVCKRMQRLQPELAGTYLALSRLAKKAIKYTIVIICFLTLLDKSNVNITPIITGIGIFSAVIAFGTQDLVKDLVAGMFVLFEHNFQVGDRVKIGGFAGEVIDVGFRTTKIKNDDGEIFIMNNRNIDNVVKY